MINFRYHLVSLTAVFLALGVGLLLGTTFLDDALENQLRSDLEELEHDLDRAGERNSELRQQLDAFEEEAGGLDEQLGARLFDGEGGLRRFLNVFVEEDDIRFEQGLDTPVAPGQTVSLLPAVAGGCGWWR